MPFSLFHYSSNFGAFRAKLDEEKRKQSVGQADEDANEANLVIKETAHTAHAQLEDSYSLHDEDEVFQYDEVDGEHSVDPGIDNAMDDLEDVDAMDVVEQQTSDNGINPNSPLSERDRIAQTYLIDSSEYKMFDFEECLKRRINQVCAAEMDAVAHGHPLFEGSKTSVGEFVDICNALFVKHDFTYQSRVELMDMLAGIFEHANVPTYARKKNKFSMSKMVEPVPDFMEFHACPSGDLIYVAANSDKTCCVKCGKARTHRCTVSFCEQPEAEARCVHFHSRTPNKVVVYRPFTEIVRNLLRFDTFQHLLAYENSSEESFGDLRNCEVPIHHLDEMYNKWETHVSDNLSNISHISRNKDGKITKVTMQADGGELIPINILLGINYDGIQPFKGRSVSFNPLIVTILNLPPFLRSVLGVGMFTLSVVTGGDSSSDDAKVLQDFVFLHCFVKELVMLDDGIILESKVSYGDKQYFVMVRLVLHMYDTRALEDIMLVQAAGAYAACPLCGIVHGGLKSELGKVVYLGHRRLLPIAHYLRRIGQGCQCCPLWFHRNYFRSLTSTKERPYMVTRWEERQTSRILTTQQLSIMEPCEGDRQHKQECNELKENAKRNEFIWFHSDIVSKPNFETYIQPELYYHYADYRPIPESFRVTTERYLRNAESAITSKRPCAGVKGLCAYALLSYFDKETQINWDPFHILMNNSKALLHLMKGKRTIPVIVDRYCSFFYFHPTTSAIVDASQPKKKQKADEATKEENPISKTKASIKRPWELSVSIQHLFDACLKGLYVPTCNKHRFEVQQPFLQTGLLGGVAKIQVFTILIHLLCSVIWQVDKTYPRRYLYFYLMYASDARRILKDQFNEAEIEDLYNCIAETIATAEGLWPHSELLYPFHQMTDLPKFIKKFGALKNWWTLPGERANAQVKRKVPTQGGEKYDRVAFKKQVQDENVVLESFYGCDLTSLLSGTKSLDEVKRDSNIASGTVDKLLKSSRTWLVSSEASHGEDCSSSICYDGKRILLLRNSAESELIELSEYENDKFHKMMHNYIEDVILKEPPCQLCELYKGSAYLRLYFMYQRYMCMRQKNNKELEYKFVDWLTDVSKGRFKPAPNRMVDIHKITNEELLETMADLWCPLASEEILSLIDIKIKFSKVARIGGVQFVGRGPTFRETEIPCDQYDVAYGTATHGYTPNKKCNALELKWQNPEQRDSWCKYESPFNFIKSSFGQLNGFFTIEFTEDKLLGIFASITERKTLNSGFDNRLDFVSLSSLENYSKSVEPFIILSAVSLYVVMHFPTGSKQNSQSKRQYPIIKPYVESPGVYKEKLGKEAFCENEDDVTHLCLIPLDA